MRRKSPRIAAAVITGATISLAAGSTAAAQPPCASTIPAVSYVCHVVGDPGEIVRLVYCTLWPPRCP
ncbi:MAG TPA: hypothetical protein VG318_11540 [Actinomycetota bacterium]|nr:hypothetical protein [Actinomycetota bacterium]